METLHNMDRALPTDLGVLIFSARLHRRLTPSSLAPLQVAGALSFLRPTESQRASVL